jgi:acylphosphatase
MYERLEIVVSGKVQGVFFRQHVHRQAKKLYLTGEVENMPDTTVRIVAEGPRDLLEKFLKHIQIGSIQSEVRDVEVEWYPIKYEFKSFEIL